MDRSLSEAITPDQSRPGSDGNSGNQLSSKAPALLETHGQIV